MFIPGTLIISLSSAWMDNMVPSHCSRASVVLNITEGLLVGAIVLAARAIQGHERRPRIGRDRSRNGYSRPH